MDIVAARRLTAFDKDFDDHFNIRSDLIAQSLMSGDGKANCYALHKSLTADPQGWGMKVRMVAKLWSYVSNDLQDYSASHSMDESLQHICLSNPCKWHHVYCTYASKRKHRGSLSPMIPNMHLVVSRYVKPWTLHRSAGLAPVLNAGFLSNKPMHSFEDNCRAEVFISHSWGEEFQLFVQTLTNTLDADQVVWICSFAIWQHGDIASSLASLDTCPFALAMTGVVRVLAVTDCTGALVDRIWCALEVEMAQRWQIPYDIALPDDSNVDMWAYVGKKLSLTDIQQCEASCKKDKEVILAHARSLPGGIDCVNARIREVSYAAQERANIMALAVTGDSIMLKQTSISMLISWRSIRGQSVAHVAAANSHVAMLMEICEITGFVHLEALDDHGRTPLSIAAGSGSLPSVMALLGIKASLETRSNLGLTPLHYAAAAGYSSVAHMLLAEGAHVEVEGCWLNEPQWRPSGIAAFEGHAAVVKILDAYSADLNAISGLGGCTPLHFAVGYSHTEVVGVLLTCRADCDNCGGCDRTPLMMACKFGRPPIVLLLLGARANPAKANSCGQTCFDVLRRRETMRPHDADTIHIRYLIDEATPRVCIPLFFSSWYSFVYLVCSSCPGKSWLRPHSLENKQAQEASGELAAC